MLFLTNIPQSLFNSVLLLGILYILFKLITHFSKLGSKGLFVLAIAIQVSTSIKLLLDIFSSSASTLFSFSTVSIHNIFLNPSNTLLIFLGSFYFVGLAIYLLYFVFQLKQLQQIKQSGNYDAQRNWLSLINDLPIKIPCNLKIGTSEKISAPMVFGFWEPIILLPISICNQLSNEEIKLILIHELAHILRNDYLINIFLFLSKTLLWFNPFSYLMSKKISLLRELACDAFVLEHANAPIPYSKALYQLAQTSIYKMPGFSLGAINNDESELVLRIKRINNIDKNKNTYKKNVQLLCITVILIMGCFMGSLFFSNIAGKKNGNKAQITLNREIQKKNTAIKIMDKNRQSNASSRTYENSNKVKSVQKIAINNNSLLKESTTTTKANFDELINETRKWIQQHEQPNQFASYTNTADSIDQIVAERFLMSSIIKSYLLKRAVMEQRLSTAKDMSEVIDYYMHSKEWDAIAEYENWAQEYLGRHQQTIGLPSTTTKQQIQYR